MKKQTVIVSVPRQSMTAPIETMFGVPQRNTIVAEVSKVSHKRKTVVVEVSKAAIEKKVILAEVTKVPHKRKVFLVQATKLHVE